MAITVPEKLNFTPAPAGDYDPPDKAAPAYTAAPEGLYDDEKSGTLRRAADYGISALKGAISIPEALVGLADIPTGGRAGKIAEEVGFKPKQAKEFLDEQLSAEQKYANKQLAETKGFLPTVGKALEFPSTIAHAVTESLPLMGAGGIAGRVALPALGAVGGAVGRAAPIIAGAAGEGVVGAGSAAEQIRQASATGVYEDPTKAGLSAVGSGLGTAAFGALGGFLARKLGIADIDTALATGKLAPAAAAGAKQQAEQQAKSWYRKLAEGAVSEGVFEEMPQSVQEQMWQNFAQDKPLMEGVPEGAAMGMLAGMAMGGPVAAVSGPPPGPISRAAGVAKGTGAAPPASAPAGPGAAPLPGPETPAAPAAPVPEDQPQLFGFTPKGAETRARLLGMQGSPQTVIPHPVHEGRFTVIPDKLSTATDTASKIDALLEQTETVINAMPAGRPATAAVAQWLNQAQEQLAKLRTQKLAEESDAEQQQVARAAKDKANAPIPYVPVETQKKLPAPAEPTAFKGEEGGTEVEAQYTGEKVDGQVHPKVGPFNLILENQAGSVRRSKAGAMQPWARKMKAHYGYFRGVAARAPDKDKVDAFVKPGTTEGHTGQAFVIEQNKADGSYDEPKVMLGYGSREEAVAGYLENYPRSQRANIHGVAELSATELRDRLNDPKAFLQPQPESTPITEDEGKPPAAEGPAEPPADEGGPPEGPAEPPADGGEGGLPLDENVPDTQAEPETPAAPETPAEPETPADEALTDEEIDKTFEDAAAAERGEEPAVGETADDEEPAKKPQKPLPLELQVLMDQANAELAGTGYELRPTDWTPGIGLWEIATDDMVGWDRVQQIKGKEWFDDEVARAKADAAANAKEQGDAPTVGGDARWTEVGTIYGENGTSLQVQMRQVRDVGEDANMLSREIALVGGRSASELAKWSVRSASTAGLEELGVKLETSIFHYTITDQSDDIFEGVDYTDGDAMWARYGPEIMAQIRASGEVSSETEQPVKEEPPALPPPGAEPAPAAAQTVEEMMARPGRAMRESAVAAIYKKDKRLEDGLAGVVWEMRKAIHPDYAVAQVGDQLVLHRNRDDRTVLAVHDLIKDGEANIPAFGVHERWQALAKQDFERRKGKIPPPPEKTHKEKLDQERTFLIVHLDDAIKEQRKLAEGKPLSEFAQNVLRLNIIRDRVASETAGAMAQGREAIEAIKAGKPVKEWKPPGLTPRQKEDLRKAREAKQKQLSREYERTLFATALTSEPIMQLAQLGEVKFNEQAPEIIGRQIKELRKQAGDRDAQDVLDGMLDGNKAKLPDKFLKSLYNQARERFKEIEKNKHRDPAIYQAAFEKAAIAANVSDNADAQAAFKDGFDHALKGKTRSTITGNLPGIVGAGYDAAKAWIQTPDGRYFYDGKREGKVQSTGEALRRHWDGMKKGLDNLTPDDMKKAWESIKRSTVRADAFPITLAEDATPGAKAWMAEFREGLATFTEYFVSRALNGVHGRHAEDVFKGKYRSSKGEFNDLEKGVGDDAQRLAKTVEMARDYITVMNDLANRFAGMKSLAEIEPVLKEIFGNDYQALRERPYIKANEHLFAAPLYHRSVFSLVLPWAVGDPQLRSRGIRWRELVKTENDAAANEATRRNPLVRPRLDKIERGGMKADRKGRNISIEEFKKVFNLDDVTVGEHVTSTEARDHLNYAYDAMMDLAEILGAKPEHLSFGGRLHFAIGALGHGKHAAHFNEAHPRPSGGSVPVINITNKSGDGALFHEYFHAIDFLTKDAATKAAIREIKEALKATPKGPDEVMEIARRFLVGGSKFTHMGRNATALDHARYALQNWYARGDSTSDKTSFFRNAQRLDQGSSKLYWSDEFEPWARASEAWGFDLLRDKSARSDYLLSPGWMADGYLKPPAFRGIPYPQGEERKGFNAIFQAFADQLEWTKDGPRLKDDAPWRTGKSPMQERKDAFHAARKEALERLPELQKVFEAEREEKERTRKEEAQRRKDEALFGKPDEPAPPPAALDPAPSPNDTGPLTDGELDIMFDDAAAQVRESIQEEPDDPGPGADPGTPGPTATIEPAAAPAETEKPEDRTAAELIKAAAAEGVKGIDETLKAIAAIFGAGPGKLASFPGGFDEDAYKKFKPHFEKALEAYKAAGKALVDFFRLLVKQFGEGIKPYAVRFAKDMKLGANLSGKPAADPAAEPAKPGTKGPEAAEADPARPIANWVQMRLEHAQPFDWRDLFQKADEAYGGTQADGKYSVKDAYDAMELGMNQFLLNYRFLADRPRVRMAELERYLGMLPTQTKRTGEQEDFQQFSTPPTHAYLANWVANVHRGESYLEPSAGVGGIGVFGKKDGAIVAVNELSARRLSLLHALPFDRFFGENAEHLNSILPFDVKPTVIVMNPPFSATAGRVDETATMNGAKHVEEALKRLQPGGRLVAIVGEGMGPDKPAFKMWWGKIKSRYTVRANIGIEGKAYVKYGTSFGNQILVIDKIGAQSDVETVTGQVATPADAIPLLEAVRVSRTAPAASTEGATPSGPETGVPGGPGAVPEGGRPGAAGLPGAGPATGVGTGQPAGPGTQPPGGRGGVPGGSAQPPGGRPGAASGGPAAGQQGGSGQSTGAATSDDPLGGRPGDLESGSQSPLVVGSAADAEAAGGEINNSVFENYTPKKVRIEGAHAHVTPLVESAALSTVLPPDITYRPHLPPAVIKEGKLSLAQLESVVYAGQAHSQMLVDGKTRRGHFIGDGTGVGKGREISGIILDNWNQGRKRHVWFSEKAHLLASAQRDFGDTGGNPDLIHSHYDYPHGKKIDLKEGILFSTYSLLRGQSGAHKAAVAAGTAPKGPGVIRFERNKQILEWLGADFDGVIAFDESHNMSNATETQGARGAKEASLQALAAIELQRILPNARVEYISATGATEIENLAYAERLGMWGPGTPFSNFVDFTAQLGRNVTVMELVAQNMKQLGLYNARSLSYNGGTPETTVVYEKLEHELTDYQTEVYDELAGGWEIVLNHINDALETTGVTRPGGGANGAMGSQIKGQLMGQFFGTMQRFFNQVITGMQMPSVFDQVDKDLAENKSVVFQLVRTQGSDLEKALGGRKAKKLKAGEEAEEIDDLDLSPREGLITFLMKAFPVKLYEVRTDAEGNQVLTLVVDANGDPVLNPEAVAARDKMVHMIRHQLRIPEGPLQQIMQKFGPEALAEVTGRTQRTVPGPKGGQILERRSKKDVAADIKAFEDGKKRVLAFNNAGGTGVSFHSDKRFKNQQRRSHYIVQTDWSANKVVQATGRTHRTNQVWAPIYRLVTTNIPAQKRFITSVARRLEQLGALTAGQRDTAGGGSLFTAADNLESEYATRAVRQFFTNLINPAVQTAGYANLVARDVVNSMGLPNLIDQQGGMNEGALPPIPQFLNRMLALRIATQKEVFKLFSDELDMQIEIAKRDGRFDDGLRTINHIGAEAIAENEVYKDDKTNASTKHFEIAVKQKNRFFDFDDVASIMKAAQKSGWFKNKQSGRVQGVWSTASMRTDASGTIHQVYGIYRTSGATYETADKLDNKNLEKLTPEQARALWKEENAKRPTETVHSTHMVVGSMLPIWNRFNNDHVDVARIKLDDGRRLLGRVIAQKDIENTLGRLNVKSREAQMKGDVILKEVLAGNIVRMSNGWLVQRSVVSGQPRVEIKNFGYPSRAVQTRMAAAGAFFEKIEHNERLFVPTNDGAVLDKLMEQFSMNPVEVKPSNAPKMSVGRTPDKVIVGKTAEGLPTYANEHVMLDVPYRPQNASPGTLWYTLFDPKKIVPGGNRNDAQIGLLEVETGPGGITQLNGIFIKPELQDKALEKAGLPRMHYGENVVRAILSSLPDGATLKIDSILPISKGFWEKIGTLTQSGKLLDNGTITRESHERNRRRIEDGRGDSGLVSQSRGRGAVSEALAEGAPGVAGAAQGRAGAARGLSPAGLRAELTERLGRAPDDVQIVRDWTELPDELAGEILATGDYNVQGIHDPGTGKTFLVSSNIEPGFGLSVYLHEVGVHKGMRDFIGQSSFDQLSRQIYEWSGSDANTEEVRLAKQAAARIPSHLGSLEYAEELVAYFVEEAVRAGHDVQEKSGIGEWMRQLAAAISSAIKKLIGRSPDLTAREIVSLAHGAAQNARVGRRRAGGAKPKFSLAANDDATRAATGVRQSVMSALHSMGSGTLAEDEGVLNAWNKTIGTPELIARKNDAFKKVFLEGQAYLGDINKFISDSEKMLPSWFKGQDALSRWFDRIRGKEVAKAEAATHALLDGTLADKVYDEDELRARGLTPAEIRMYEEARNAVDAMLEKTGIALINKEAAEWGPLAQRLMLIFRQNGRQGIEEFAQYSEKIGKAKIKNLKKEIADSEHNPSWRDIRQTRLEIEQKRLAEWEIVVNTVTRINKLQKEGYFPLSRFGTHYVSVIDPRGEAVEFRMYESEALARVGAVQMVKKYPQYEVKRGTVSQHSNELFRGLTPEAVELFAEMLGHDQDAAMQAWLKEAVANRSALKRMIHRKGTEGYSRDAVRVLADFISTNARYTSRLAHNSKLDSYVRDIKGGELRDYAIKLVQYLRGDDGREEYHGMRGFLFFQYIGGNISSALLNLTQVPMVTLPWLTQHTSAANATAALTRAYKVALSTEPEQIQGEVGEALRKAETEGLTDPQNVYNTMAIGSGSKLARVRAFSSFLDAWAFLFGRAERVNRRVTFMAAFEVARANGKSAAEAYDIAKDGVETTQFIYNKGNRPTWARGLGAIPFTFKQFTIGMLETIFSRMPVRQRMIILGLLLLGAGAEGLPFAEDIEDIIDTIGQQLGYATNSKQALKEALQAGFQEFAGLPLDTAIFASEMVRRGVFANTPLATVGTRIGMGNIIPGSSIFLTGRDKASDITEAGGPLASFTANVSSAAELIARGQFGRAAEKAAPTGAANIFKGVRQLAEGREVTPFGKAIAEVPPEQALLQTIGISSQKVAKARERTDILKQNEAYLKVVEDRIADKWAQAIIDKDPEKRAEAREELRAHNERNPDQKIRITPAQIQARVKNLRRDPEKALLRGVAKERRQQAREFLTQ